jgi:type VI secretion system protein ImpC
MAGSEASERIGFTIGTSPQRSSVGQEIDRPFRIAVIGDFSGRGASGQKAEQPLAKRRAILVDRDNFEDVMMSVGPSITVSYGDGTPHPPIRFAELDDFHPDRLYERLPVFRALRALRRRLADPATFAEAAGELLSPAREEPAPAAPLSAPPADLLEAILGGAEAAAARPVKPRDDFQSYLKEIVAPHLVPGEDPRQPAMLAKVDAAATLEMRAILHHPAFQELESLWRALFLLVRGLETSAELQIFLIDATRAEIVQDLLADTELESTGLYKLLADPSAGDDADGWSLFAGAYTFGVETDDLVVLGRMSAIAREAGAPWISAADSRLAGCPSFESYPDPDDWAKALHGGWQALRELPGAQYIGLAAPRFLLRLPYGKNADECELFQFEELGSPSAHEDYLWGNPAVACALLLGKAVQTGGPGLRLGRAAELDRLPQHLFREDGEMNAKPCAEIVMSERAAARLMEAGIIPFASIKGTDRIRVLRFQSIAIPPAALAGSWFAG